MDGPAELPYQDEDIVKLTSSDDVEFETTVGVAKQSETISNLIVDCDLSNAIPLPNVTAVILEKVLEYLKMLSENPRIVSEKKNEDEKRQPSDWELEFCAEQPQAILFELILASNYLDIKQMLDATCKTVANMIKGKTTEEIRATFNITNDFTAQEEEQIRKENAWCEER
jgi:S-phase kinase-associated protein 1